MRGGAVEECVDDNAMHELRTERVSTMLTPSEYIALARLVERLGISQSSAIRMWIREVLERHAAREGDPAEVRRLA